MSAIFKTQRHNFSPAKDKEHSEMKVSANEAKLCGLGKLGTTIDLSPLLRPGGLLYWCFGGNLCKKTEMTPVFLNHAGEVESDWARQFRSGRSQSPLWLKYSRCLTGRSPKLMHIEVSLQRDRTYIRKIKDHKTVFKIDSKCCTFLC
jgi:hypothetical protein